VQLEEVELESVSVDPDGNLKAPLWVLNRLSATV